MLTTTGAQFLKDTHGIETAAVDKSAVAIVRYGRDQSRPHGPLLIPMVDGYWTPWHIADAEVTRLRAALAAAEQQRDEACDYLRRAGTIIAMQGDQAMALSCAKNADRIAKGEKHAR